MMRLQLFHTDGSRKYLTHAERHAFLDAAERFPRDVHTLCAVLAWTGCRVSEALALTADRVDLTNGTIRFESVKKRRRGVFRAVPVPPELLRMLTLAHDVRMLQQRKDRGHGVRLWPWSRTTAWRHVHAVMGAAGASTAPRRPPRDYAMASAWRRSKPVSRSIWCSAGWGMLVS